MNIISYQNNKLINTYAEHTEYTMLFFEKMTTILQNAHIICVHKKNYTIGFEAPVFRYAWNGFNLFNGITKGEMEIVNARQQLYVKYKLIFTEVFVLCSIFSIIPFMGMFETLLHRAIAFGIIWAVYLGNMFLCNSRLRSVFKMIEKEINEMPEQVKVANFNKQLNNGTGKK